MFVGGFGATLHSFYTVLLFTYSRTCLCSSACVDGNTPAIRSAQDHARPCSSRVSHARASRQSRITVCGETPSASAVSSTLSPPKNRISITLRAARIELRQARQGIVERTQFGRPIGLRRGKLVEIDRRVACAAAVSVATALRRRRARAASTRMRRMMRADTAKKCPRSRQSSSPIFTKRR